MVDPSYKSAVHDAEAMARLRPGRFEGVYESEGRLLTRSLAPGRKVYGEDIVLEGGVEYRAWDPRRSKLAAAILNGLRELPLGADSRVLYLGAASGTTASHVSDICSEGMVYCVELAPRPFRDLIALCESRSNMAPILADAGAPSGYSGLVGQADFVYQDIAQRDQVELLARNLEALPPSSGRALLMVKSRSVDVSAKPAKVFARVAADLVRRGYEVVQSVDLAPYERDHCAMAVALPDPQPGI
jgi:fibrillarin-like pre-rRNA processing protein